MKKDITIMAIETSCDETSVAIVKNGKDVLTNIISSQIDLHEKFGGVVPEIASRKHIENIDYVINEALQETKMKIEDMDAIAVTYGPGLVGALLVGLAEAKAIAFAAKKPLIGVHHIEGHISANYIENDLKPPFISMVVSGGHTHLVHVKDYGVYEILGKTRDDAVGEAFDKVARSIGLGYPGGPKIDKISKQGDENSIDFPRSYLEEDCYDFSFSGVKSAVLNYINKCKMKQEEINQANIAASFQKAVVDVIVDKTVKSAKELGLDKVALAGGVAANSRLREEMKKACEKEQISLYCPSIVYCTDNAAMIGVAAYYEYINGVRHNMDLNAIPNLKLGNRV